MIIDDALHRLLLDNLTTATLLLDDNLRLVYMNPAAEMLLAVSGQRSHGQFISELFTESAEAQTDAPDPSYRLRLSPVGRRSPIMQQSPDPNLNELIWGSLPSLHWRLPLRRRLRRRLLRGRFCH